MKPTLSAIGRPQRTQLDASDSRALLCAMAVIIGSYAFVQNMVAPALPRIGQDFQVSLNRTGLVFSVFLATASVAAPISTRLAQRLGTAPVLRATLLLVAVGGMIVTLAPNFTTVLVGRGLQGLIGAALPLGIAIVGHHVPLPQAGHAIGFLSGSLGLGGCLGVALGGPLADAYGFRVVCAVMAAVNIAAAVVGWLNILSTPATPAEGSRWSVVVLLSVAVLATAAALDILPRVGSGGLPIAVAVVIGVVAVALLVGFGRATHSDSPAVRLQWIAVISSGLAGFVMFVQFTLVPYAVSLQQSGTSLAGAATMSSICLLLLNLGLFVGGWLAGRTTARLPRGGSLLLWSGMSLAGIVLSRLGLTSVGLLAVAQGIVGTGVGALLVVGPAFLAEVLPPASLATASGHLTISKNVGSILGGHAFAISIAVAAAGIGVTTAGLSLALWSALAAAVLLGAIGLLAPKRRMGGLGV